MHCEQNFTENILKIVIGEKDSVKVKRDLQHRGIKLHLWLTTNPWRDVKMLKPISPYVLTTVEFETFSTTIEILKTPSRHVSIMGKYIKFYFLVGLSHMTIIF